MQNPLKYLKTLKIDYKKMATFAKAHSKNHYDALGITTKATQADIKSAYYKLSKVYHPDKNVNNEDAASRFRDITEAYEVLGNVRSRKMYDRGMFIDRTPSKVEEELNKFHKSREEMRSRQPTTYGRTSVYDFDEWSRAHYGATFRRTKRYKEQQEAKQVYEKRRADDVKAEKVIVAVTMLVITYAIFSITMDSDVPVQIARTK